MASNQWNLLKQLPKEEVRSRGSAMTASKTIQVKLIKSGIGRIKKHKLCIQGLGFKKLNQVVTVEDTPSNRGMINKISDMVEVVG